jgi:PBP1b-binding outer membrane lipoprotein LpoB
MSKYLSKSSFVAGLGLSIPTALVANIAQTQAQSGSEDRSASESTAANTNHQTQKANLTPSTGINSTAIGTNGNGSINYTFVVSTPVAISIAVIVGGIALFPVISLVLNSRKATKLGKVSLLSKWSSRFRKPQVLESDRFLHQRNFEKLAQITNQAENLNADKFGNTEFMVFFKIKSYIARAIDEYANLDEVIDMLTVAIGAQHSFLAIDSTESRYCSSSQQELYKFVNGLLDRDLEPTVFQAQIEQKLQEILPLLKTDEGKVALTTYIKEVSKISNNSLGLKLLLLFKKYQLDDYSTLRSVANTITQLESEDLLNLDSLLLLVMVKYDVFEKLGPIVGIDAQYNRPETYSKMLQYIGLKSRHEASYQKFKEFLLLLKQWETPYKSIVNVREKYSASEYRLPPDFNADAPGMALYQKYKDSFHLIAPATPPTATKVAEILSEPPVLTSVK